MKNIVVVPTYNEKDNLEPLLVSIWQYVPELHVLLVDDNSPDGTGRLADELSLRHRPKFFVLHRDRKAGLGKAYAAGFKQVLADGYARILQMDGDLSHDASHLPALIDRLKTHDLVLGSRYSDGGGIENWDARRLMLSRAASTYARIVTGMPFTDLTGGFKAWNRQALEQIGLDDLQSTGYLFQIETTYRLFLRGGSIAEVPIVFRERRNGVSKLDWPIIAEAAGGVVALRLSRKFHTGKPRQEMSK